MKGIFKRSYIWVLGLKNGQNLSYKRLQYQIKDCIDSLEVVLLRLLRTDVYSVSFSWGMVEGGGGQGGRVCVWKKDSKSLSCSRLSSIYKRIRNDSTFTWNRLPFRTEIRLHKGTNRNILDVDVFTDRVLVVRRQKGRGHRQIMSYSLKFSPTFLKFT